MRHLSARQVTLRGLPDSFYRSLRAEARRSRKSINKVLLHRLNIIQQKKIEGACTELLQQAGTWDKKRARDFDRKAKIHRRIDRELWS